MWEPPLVFALLLHSYLAPAAPQSDRHQSRAEGSGTATAVQTEPANTDAAGALHAAVRAGDVNEVLRLLTAGADPNAPDALGGAPLLTACWLGHASIVSVLLSHGANVNAIHREAGASALEYAVLKGRPDIVEMLLRAGANVGKRYRDGQTVLHLAAARTSVPVIDELIAAGADPAAIDATGNTPLDLAVLGNRPEAVRTLLDHGASLKYVHPADGRGALHEACMKGGTRDRQPAHCEGRRSWTA